MNNYFTDHKIITLCMIYAISSLEIMLQMKTFNFLRITLISVCEFRDKVETHFKKLFIAILAVRKVSHRNIRTKTDFNIFSSLQSKRFGKSILEVR